ncbi:MAG: hypothetical protein EOP84_02705 [Verrucomicrobiaceae bacterium]|nr:MAG: hypothetical protein EOP84_02705 [Verrucomicrobiaceae bacterium]
MKFKYDEYYVMHNELKWAMGLDTNETLLLRRAGYNADFEFHLNEILDWCRENFEPDTWRFSRREWAFFFAEDRQRVMFKMFFS